MSTIFWKKKKSRMERSLIIGMGEIGTALYKALSREKVVFCRDIEHLDLDNVGVMHVTIPYSEKFVDIVRDYVEYYNPLLTIIYSTVPIGTCESIGDHIVHSPIEGRHPLLEDSILIGPRWLGCKDQDALNEAMNFWGPIAKIIRTMRSSRYTEFLKIRSTAKYGINIVWTDYEKKVADKLGVSFKALQAFDTDYNELYDKLGFYEFKRYILDPPNGEIRGHCVVPNAELLDKQYPHPMLKMIKKMKPKKRGKK